MKIRNILLAILTLCLFVPSNAEVPNGYYDTCEGLTGEPLLKALYSKISSHTAVSYNGLWDLYKTTDVNKNGKIIDIYSTKLWNASEKCGTGKSCVGSCYTREHSFPKSWFGGSVMPMYTDAFHIYPADFYINNQRSNYPYGECANGVTKSDCNGFKARGKLGTSTFSGYSGKVFEPDDEYKGDLARGYFYMAACYYNQISTWTGDMMAGNKYPAFSDWALKLLLKWHRQDPVSDKELARQEVVYGKQKNRNPFIDHPELVEYIWGDRKGHPWSNGLQGDPVINNPVSGSTVDFGSVKVGQNLTVKIPVVGSWLTEDIVVAIDNRPSTADESTDLVPDIPDTPLDFYSFVWTTPEELTPAQSVTGMELSVNGTEFKNGPVTVLSSKETASTDPRLYVNSGNVALRLYAGNTTTFTSKEGNIKAIDLGTSASAMYGVATVSSGELSADGLRWTGDAKSVTFTWKKYAKTVNSTSATNNPILTYFTVYTDAEYDTSADILNATLFGIPTSKGGSYTDFTATGETGRKFAANAYGKKSFIQLRSTNNSGIVSTSKGSGAAQSIKIKWSTETQNTEKRELQVYGSNTAYTSVADLYDTAKQGTLLGSFSYSKDAGDEAKLALYDTPYKYIGMRSKSGALYIDEIEITWDEEPPFRGYRSLEEWVKAKPSTAQSVRKPATVIYQNNDWLYMTDSRTNILVHGDLGRSYNPGDIIPEGFAGTYTLYNEVPTMVPDASTFGASTGVAEKTPAAHYVELMELTTADINRYVAIDRVAMTGSKKVYTATASDGTTIRVYDQFGLGLSAATDAELEGFINLYQGNLQFVPVKFTANPQREFTSTQRTITASKANSSTTVSVNFTPRKAGTFYATLQLRSGDLSSVVYLTGKGVNSLTALPAKNVSSDAFNAHWVDMNDGEGTYLLDVCQDGVSIDGYPKYVASGMLQYEVENLDDDTDYTYYLTDGSARTQIINVKTDVAQPEIDVIIDGEMSEIEGIVNDENQLSFFTSPGSTSPHATLLIYTYLIEDDLEISVKAPFQISTDLTNWENELTVSAATDHIYMRLIGDAEGTYYADLTVKGGFIPAQSLDGSTAGSWRAINDNISLYGKVANDVTSIASVTSVSKWEAYSLDHQLVVENFDDKPVKVGIYTIDGYAIKTLKARQGKNMINLPAGFYLVATEGQARRVVVK